MDPSVVYSSPFLEGARMSASTNFQLPSGLGLFYFFIFIFLGLF